MPHPSIADYHRAAFDALETIAGDERPTFTLAHIVMPHPPYVLDRDGRVVLDISVLRGQWGGAANERGYLEQVRYVDRRIMEVIDTILARSSTRPIIILQGDHGSWSTRYEDGVPHEEVAKERMSILNAYLVPDGVRGLLYPSITPVNTFRAIDRGLFDEQVELLPDESWYGDGGPPSNSSGTCRPTDSTRATDQTRRRAARGQVRCGMLAAAASSRIQVAPSRRASWAGQRSGIARPSRRSRRGPVPWPRRSRRPGHVPCGADDRRVEGHPRRRGARCGSVRGSPARDSAESSAAEPGKTESTWPSPPTPSRTQVEDRPAVDRLGPVGPKLVGQRRGAPVRAASAPRSPRPSRNGWTWSSGIGGARPAPAGRALLAPADAEHDVVERLDVRERVVARDEPVVAPPDVEADPRDARPSAATRVRAR